MAMSVTLDRAAGTFRMAGGQWTQVLPLDRLPGQLAFYRSLWSRGSKVKGGPGPWARHYEETVAALDAAIRELADG
jgi:hypothetical protein